jgi:hypothetical protein
MPETQKFQICYYRTQFHAHNQQSTLYTMKGNLSCIVPPEQRSQASILVFWAHVMQLCTDISCAAVHRHILCSCVLTHPVQLCTDTSCAAVYWHILRSCVLTSCRTYTAAVLTSNCPEQFTHTLQYPKEPTKQHILSVFLADFESHILDTGRADNMLNRNLHKHWFSSPLFWVNLRWFLFCKEIF